MRSQLCACARVCIFYLVCERVRRARACCFVRAFACAQPICLGNPTLAFAYKPPARGSTDPLKGGGFFAGDTNGGGFDEIKLIQFNSGLLRLLFVLQSTTGRPAQMFWCRYCFCFVDARPFEQVPPSVNLVQIAHFLQAAQAQCLTVWKLWLHPPHFWQQSPPIPPPQAYRPPLLL